MATMFPKECKSDVNDAEKKVFKILNTFLDEDIVCYHNYNVGVKETDFIVVVPGEGVCIIEVKGWTGRTITRIIDKDTIEYMKNGQFKTDKSPLSQCKGYCYNLRKKIHNELKSNFKIIPVVFFPYMTEYTYYDKQLNIITPREVTILQDDIEDRNKFKNIIKQKLRNIKSSKIDEFTEKLYVNFCGIFEDNEILKNRLAKNNDQKKKIVRIFTERKYSILSYFSLDEEENLFNDQMEKYFNKWIVGSKIILIVKTKEDFHRIIKYFEIKINNEMAYLNAYDAFNIYDSKGYYKNRIFNLEIYFFLEEYNNQLADFILIDGNDIEKHIDELKLFNKITDFNFNQYELEHASKDGNIVVKAGAGTGKTYSMISRVGYLYYINNYIPEDLLNRIIMITFTNDATDNMKIKLKEYFTNLAILTECSEFIHIMEYISKMNISTIDSLMKKILQKFSVYLGLGNNIRITTEIYDTRKEIAMELERLLTKDKYSTVFQLVEKHNISKVVEKFIDMTYKKKIDLNENNNFKCIDGKNEKKIFELIKEAATNVNDIIIKKNIKNNVVNLNNLPAFMKKLIEKFENNNFHRHLADYIFIDEFQDTDDLTIELIQRYYNIFNFNVFVVGDIKQSIYRFRGADDAAFDKLKKKMFNWVVSKISNKDYFTINKNYRSCKELLNKFDIIFKQWGKGIDRYGQILNYLEDDKLIGVFSNNSTSNCITLIPYQDNQFEKKLINLVEEKITNLKNNNMRGSIAILVRENKEVEYIRKIGEKIKARTQISIETNKVDNLYKMAATIDLYRLVLALKYYNNAKYLYSLSLSNYATSISYRDVYRNRDNDEHIKELFKQNKIIKNWYGKNSILSSLRSQTILRVIRGIIRDTKPWDQYARNFNEEHERKIEKIRYKRNLDLLLENIIQRSNAEYVTINSLAKFLYIMIFAKQHQDERKDKNDENKIKVICETIHKSKGLEYDDVIIPFTFSQLSKRYGDELIINSGLINTKLSIKIRNGEKIQIKSVDFDKETKIEFKDLMKEEARILYVALTRAKNTVTWFNKTDSKNKLSWSYLLKQEGDKDE